MASTADLVKAIQGVLQLRSQYGQSAVGFPDCAGLPDDQRRACEIEKLGFISSQAPSVLENLAAQPKDPYYQAVYGLAEVAGQREAQLKNAVAAALEKGDYETVAKINALLRPSITPSGQAFPSAAEQAILAPGENPYAPAQPVDREYLRLLADIEGRLARQQEQQPRDELTAAEKKANILSRLGSAAVNFAIGGDEQTQAAFKRGAENVLKALLDEETAARAGQQAGSDLEDLKRLAAIARDPNAPPEERRLALLRLKALLGSRKR
jgi:hypothetical protein